jgi:hypothetical protein
MVDMERVVTLDELMERVPEDLVRDAESRKTESTKNHYNEENMSKEPSKAKRIREYMDNHPEARNKDIVDALGTHGITSADVANVKSHIKRNEAKSSKKTSASKPKADATASSTSTTAMTSTGPTINWRELDAGVAFVKAAGSVQRAQHLLIIIEQIKAC